MMVEVLIQIVHLVATKVMLLSITFTVLVFLDEMTKTLLVTVITLWTLTLDKKAPEEQLKMKVFLPLTIALELMLVKLDLRT